MHHTVNLNKEPKCEVWTVANFSAMFKYLILNAYSLCCSTKLLTVGGVSPSQATFLEALKKYLLEDRKKEKKREVNQKESDKRNRNTKEKQRYRENKSEPKSQFTSCNHYYLEDEKKRLTKEKKEEEMRQKKERKEAKNRLMRVQLSKEEVIGSSTCMDQPFEVPEINVVDLKQMGLDFFITPEQIEVQNLKKELEKVKMDLEASKRENQLAKSEAQQARSEAQLLRNELDVKNLTIIELQY